MTDQRSPNRPFATSIGSYGHAEFIARARRIPVPASLDRHPKAPFSLRDEWQMFRNVLKAARREQLLVLFSSRGRLKPELLAIALIALWPRSWRPKIILQGEMYQPDTGMRYVLERMLLQLVDRAVTRYALFSNAEAEIFARLWGISTIKLRVCRITYGSQSEHAHAGPKPRQPFIFAGGNAFREYEPLLEAARCMPDLQFFISTTCLADRADLPSNVHVEMVDHERFVALMDHAAAVVVPLQKGLERAAGLMTYLEAMSLGAPVIVSDALAVREYVEDGVTGLVVDGSADSYVRSIRWMTDPANKAAVDQLGAQAQQAIHDQNTYNSMITQVLRVVDEVLDEAESPPSLSLSSTGTV